MTYSLAVLLKKQSPTIKRHPDFLKLAQYLNNSRPLQTLRLSRTAFALLNEPRLKKKYIENFRATYHFPDSLFLSLFLDIKWQDKKQKEVKRNDRKKAIRALMAGCPREVLGIIEYLARVERACNQKCPVWTKDLWPRTKKKAVEMVAFTDEQWETWLTCYISALPDKYRTLKIPDADIILACMHLECLPDPVTGKLPSRAAIRSQYKKRAIECHPDTADQDTSGDFLRIKKSYDRLERLF